MTVLFAHLSRLPQFIVFRMARMGLDAWMELWRRVAPIDACVARPLERMHGQSRVYTFICVSLVVHLVLLIASFFFFSALSACLSSFPGAGVISPCFIGFSLTVPAPAPDRPSTIYVARDPCSCSRLCCLQYLL